MTVAIAWERYIAVHYPLDYNQGSEIRFTIDAKCLFFAKLSTKALESLFDPPYGLS
jgi:hypothetical protein